MNLRAAAGTDSAIVAVIPYGTRVQAERATVEGSDGAAWRSVMYDGANGFVLDSLLCDRSCRRADGGYAPAALGQRAEWTLTAVGDICSVGPSYVESCSMTTTDIPTGRRRIGCARRT
ncbi:MAG: hypothetical protein WKH64_12170 [Chloroflexia bacterium]